MDTEIKSALDAHGAAIDSAIRKYEEELKIAGSASSEAKAEVKALASKFESMATEFGQKIAGIKDPGSPVIETAGSEFIKSEAFKQLIAGTTQRARLEVKNTVTSVAGSTTHPTQRAGVIAGSFAPLTVRDLFRVIPVTSNAVYGMRESAWTNSAAEVADAGNKAESSLTFEAYNTTIQTVAHFIKVSNQLMADAPAVMAYIDTRLRDGLAQRIDAQLLNGDGTSPNLSGLTDSGNFTAYTATAGDLLIDAVNRAKYTLWAAGNMPDTVIINPADWGSMERTREGSGSGMYLYGAPGTIGSVNPFGLRVVLSNNMTSGKFLVGALDMSTVVYERQGAVVEMGYVNADFTNNLVTIRAEERLALAVERPAAILYGNFTA